MNNKGFTLVELLAVVVILGLVMGIASYGVLSAIESSRNSSEKVLVEKIEGLIDEYLSLYGSGLKVEKDWGTFQKCNDRACNTKYDVNVVEVESFELGKIVSAELVDEDKMVNPRNKKKCLDGKNPTVRVFRDSEYVYYYYVDLSGDKTSCEVSDANGVINTLPSNLRGKVGLS